MKKAPVGRIQIRINRPVKSLFPRCRIKASDHICPLCPSSLALLEKKFNFTGCAAVLTELFFVKTKQQMSGNTLCIAGHFCEVWAEKSRSKPISPYLNSPLGSFSYLYSLSMTDTVNLPSLFSATQLPSCFLATDSRICVPTPRSSSGMRRFLLFSGSGRAGLVSLMIR